MNTTSNYDADSIGTRSVYAAMSSAVLKKRSDASVSLNMVQEYEDAKLGVQQDNA